MKKYIKYLFLVLEASSIPLLFIITILILSGYGILYPSQIKMLTGGLMTERLAYKIHTDKIIRLTIDINIAFYTWLYRVINSY